MNGGDSCPVKEKTGVITLSARRRVVGMHNFVLELGILNTKQISGLMTGTERSGLVVNNSTSCSGGPGFKFRSGYRLS
jgi:hypothetical protein